MRATKRHIAAVGLALAAALMSGCSTPADPSATEPQPMFTSDAAAFAAAEETYRAYVDASNSVVLADTGTFEPVFALTDGALNAVDRKTLSDMHAKDSVVDGETRILEVRTGDISPLRDQVNLFVCLEVSAVQVFDATGISVVDPSRRPVQSLSVSFASSPVDHTTLAVVLLESAEGIHQCD